MKLSIWITILFSFPYVSALADEGDPKFSNESELGVVLTSGNAETESVSAKQTSGYEWTGNLVKLEGKYLTTKSNSIETAKSWNLGLRYEREITSDISGYAGPSLESDIFSGYIQRNNCDAGLKVKLVNTDTDKVNAEAGYRYTFDQTVTRGNFSTNFGRLYTEWTRDWKKGISHKLWIEYLPNFTTAEAYFVNFEPSVSVALSEVFSLKLAYLSKYQNNPQAGKKQRDTTLTSVLAAKF